MKILCVADQRSPLVYSTGIKERFKDVDLVLGAGDLPMDYYGYIVSSLNKRLYFVFGNHNLKHYDRLARKSQAFSFDPESVNQHSFGSILATGRVIRDKKTGLIIVGMGGSIDYNHGVNQYTDSQMYLKLFRLIPRLLWNKLIHGRYMDIFLTHSPPRGLNDREDPCHRGFKSFVWFLDRFKPKYMLHGHIHLYERNIPREIQYKNTKIINVFDYYVLEPEL
ncbi:metallophosphoesterase [Spirochaeta isovalerica]|uniref:Icc-related predicted phosphoesterase n=1 Tax=Spirochaeta isovalerica TaxID=150 RepID=A0A841R0D1_9SPIO|nr:metallophosphoesterase [Spirochaeta isovalerica]MBB6478394.1 Icc-related predicted phosphoesterase [Spirochaeta isovalerica]